MILDEIVKYKAKEISRLQKHGGLFYRALKNTKGLAVIAEIKRKSPSKGVLRKNFDAVKLAKEFEGAGASALSILTDKKFFGGSAEILKKVRRATHLPILRKDFILSESQVVESLAMGADAILLIAAILTPKKLKELSALAGKLGLDVLFEAHTVSDIRKILPLKPRILGINNRDLRSFHVDLAFTETLACLVPESVLLVSESGIRDGADMKRVQKCGVKAVLVGESLMIEKNPGEALKKLRGRGIHGSR